MLGGITTVFRKEFLDILRDRKTLIFMLMVPTLAVPLLIVGSGRLVQSIQKAQQVKTVTILADNDTRIAYRNLVHTWFLESQIGRALKAMDSPFLSALVKQEEREQFSAIPSNVTTDPDAFEEWARSVADMIKDNLDSYEAQQSEELLELNEAQRQEAIDFYRVVIKGLALVEFVDLDIIENASSKYNTNDIPETLRDVPNIKQIANLLNDREVQGVMQIPGSVEEVLANDQSELPIVFYFDSTVSLSGEAHRRVLDVSSAAGRQIVDKRLEGRGLRHSFADPVVVEPGTNVATTSKLVLVLAGSILPYLVIICAFLGAIYPSIDLGAGEKERQTLETLLLSPVSRTQIAIGKFLVILCTSLIAALLGITALIISIQFLIPSEVIESFDISIDPTIGFFVALMALPVAAAFAGVMLALSIYARSFKEAQNYMAPLQFVLILPALAPMLPGVEMNWKIAFIPLVNVAMLTREFLKGDVNWGYYGVTLGSCLALATLCVAFCVQLFNREKVLFRS